MLKYIFIDDDVAFLKMLQVFFGSAPHYYTSDVRQVPDILKTHPFFDAMISDYDMPYGNGIAWAEWVHALHPNLPIMVLSGHEKPKCLPDSIQNWILKPVDLNVLDREIRSMIEKTSKSENV